MNVRLKNLNLLLALVAGLLLLTSGCAHRTFHQQSLTNARFDFALIGDVPYNEDDATNAYPKMIREINRSRLAFVVHDGDIKSGASPCSNEAFTNSFKQFQTFRHPIVYVFGDNEWTDCARGKTNGFDPVERLDKLRQMFTSGNQSLGHPAMPLTRQSEDAHFPRFRENVRWVYGHVLFAGLNVPGDANNFDQREYAERNKANLAWVKEAFVQARRDNMRGLMLIMQANPRFDLNVTNKVRAGFNDLLNLLEQETVAFQKPVVLVHGDTHYFRIDKPLMGSKSKRRIENFTRVETFGNPDVHWLRASVDWRDPNVFSFRQEIVAENLVKHGSPFRK